MKWFTLSFLFISAWVHAASGALVIDVRTPAEYQQEHIPGALNIEYQNVPREIARLAPDKSAPIILYCHSGRRAGIAHDQLKTLGYTSVENAGGLSDMKKRIK